MTSDSDLDSNISLWQSSSSWPAPSLSQSWPLVTWILKRNLPPGYILTTTKLSPLQISLWWWNGWFMFWQDISSVQLWKRICRVMSVWVDAVLQWCLQCCSWSAVLPPPPVFKQANYATCDLEPERGLDFYVAFLDAVLCAFDRKLHNSACPCISWHGLNCFNISDAMLLDDECQLTGEGYQVQTSSTIEFLQLTKLHFINLQ